MKSNEDTDHRYRVSNLIKELQDIVDKHGDIELMTSSGADPLLEVSSHGLYTWLILSGKDEESTDDEA